jgi:ABC-type thiamine transport system ATPase subunit
VFALKENSDIMVTNGALNREIKHVGDVDEEQARWLAVAVLRDKPILLVDNPSVGAAGYLKMQAQKGRVVIVTTQEEDFRLLADKVVEIIS